MKAKPRFSFKQEDNRVDEYLEQPKAKSEPEPIQEPTPARTNKVGRPPGKRTNPDYEQVTSYIRKDTYQNVKVLLIQQGEKKEFSELVQELLAEWVEQQKT